VVSRFGVVIRSFEVKKDDEELGILESRGLQITSNYWHHDFERTVVIVEFFVFTSGETCEGHFEAAWFWYSIK
jgi:hypothetical protein